MPRFFRFVPISVLSVLLFLSPTFGGDLTVRITGDDSDITFFGAFYHWDADGLPKKADGSAYLPDTKEKIDAPYADGRAVRVKPGEWLFEKLPAGTYDLILIKAGQRLRLEGYRFAPVLDFDPFLPPDAKVLRDVEEDGVIKEQVDDKESRDFVEHEITSAPHYENKVVPVALGGSYKKGQEKPKFIRAVVMLLRDETTTYEGDMAGAATLRFEIWEFADKTGTYVKNRKTHVMRRIILTRDEVRKWTWLWDPALGNIEVPQSGGKTVEYALPDPEKSPELKGLRPY